MAMVRVGDTVWEHPSVCVDNHGVVERRPLKGKITYIHPRRHFYVVTFETAGGPIREAFWGGWRQLDV